MQLIRYLSLNAASIILHNDNISSISIICRKSPYHLVFKVSNDWNVHWLCENSKIMNWPYYFSYTFSVVWKSKPKLPGVSFCNTLWKTFKFRRNIPKRYSNLSVGNTCECHGTNKKTTIRLTMLYKN